MIDLVDVDDDVTMQQISGASEQPPSFFQNNVNFSKAPRHESSVDHGLNSRKENEEGVMERQVDQRFDAF